MNNQFYQRMEIAFWDFAIRTMSENQNFRSFIQDATRLLHHKDLPKNLLKIGSLLAAGAVAGLFCGLFFSMVVIYLR
jgi:hypothetical protein